MFVWKNFDAATALHWEILQFPDVLEAMSACVPCKFCGGLAVVQHSGPIKVSYVGYQVYCENTRPVEDATCTQVSFSAQDKSISTLWNEHNRFEPALRSDFYGTAKCWIDTGFGLKLN